MNKFKPGDIVRVIPSKKEILDFCREEHLDGENRSKYAGKAYTIEGLHPIVGYYHVKKNEKIEFGIWMEGLIEMADIQQEFEF